MRILGFLFVLILLLAVVGYFRGWYSVNTTQAAGKGDVTFGVTVGVDEENIREDATTTTNKLQELSAKAVASLKSLGKKISPSETDLDGTVVLVDPATRDITLSAGNETVELHVREGVPLTRDGNIVAFEALQPATPVRLTFERTDEVHSLKRIRILP